MSPTGQVLSSLAPPDIVLTDPVIADFNNDGLNGNTSMNCSFSYVVQDLIIVTARGYYGYTLTRTSGSLLLPLLSLSLLGVIAFLFIYGNLNNSEPQIKGKMGKKAVD